MNLTTYEQFPISQDLVGEQKNFLKEDSNIRVAFYKENPIHIDFPEFVELKVTTSPPSVHEKEAVMKKVTLENGLEILAPQFIKEGDLVKVNTQTQKYVEKIKK
jgi:elongation factor P